MGFKTINLMGPTEKEAMIMYCQNKVLELDEELKKRRTYDKVDTASKFLDKYILSKAGVVTFSFISLATLNLTDSVLVGSILPGTLFATSTAITAYKDRNSSLVEQPALHNKKRAYLYVIDYLQNGSSAVNRRLQHPEIPINVYLVIEPYEYGKISLERNLSDVAHRIGEEEKMICQFDGIKVEEDPNVNFDQYLPEEDEAKLVLR